MTTASPRLVSLRRFRQTLIAALSCFVAGLCQAQTVTLLKTDLDSALPGAYPNGAVINSSGTSTSQLTVAQTSPQGVSVVGTTGTNLVLEFIDNSMGTASCYVKRTFTALSTTGTGNNAITGSFSVTPLGGTTGSNPTCELLINAGTDGPGASVTAVQIDIRGNGSFSYKTASGTVTGPTLTVGTKYTVSFLLDLSSTSQDTWNLAVTNAGTGVIVYTVTNLTTRAANVAPDRIVFNGGVNTTDANASAFIQIDDLDFSSAPAPAPVESGTPLLMTKLDSATPGTYANASVINSSGTVTSQLTVAQASPQVVQIVSAGTNQALQFIDSSTVSTNCYAKKTFTALSTTGTGNNLLTGRFSVVPLGGSTGSNPTFQFLVNSGFDTAGSTVSAIQFEIRGSGATSYKTSGSTVNGPALTVGTKYDISIALDLSSPTQDTWGFVVSRSDTGAIASSASGLATRAANTAPDRIVLNGGVNAADSSASPFIQIDDLRFLTNSSSGSSQMPLRLGGGDMVNGDISAATEAKFQALKDLGAGLARMGLYPTYYWNFSGTAANTVRTEAVEAQMVMAHSKGITPMLFFQHYGSYQSLFPLGDYNKWFQIGQAFATKYSPNSAWLVSQGITDWGVTQFYAINEPDGTGAANIPAIPITGTSSYYEALRGLADGVHSVNPSFKVFPGGFARPNSANDWTCGGYATAIAPLLNNGTLDGITLHTYYDSTASTGTAIAYAPMDGTYTNSCQYTFEQVKAACGITRDINFYCDEFNYRKGNDTEANSAAYFLTALWDAIGVTGNSGSLVSQCAIPWNLFNLSTSDPDYGMSTQSSPWLGTARGQVFQLVASLTSGMDIVSANPKTTGEYKLTGGNKTLWVWQNRSQWTNHAGTSYTVLGIPAAATSLTIYNSTGLIQTIPLSGQSSYTVTGLTTGQTYMFLLNSQ